MRLLQQARERLAQRTEFITVTLVLGALLGILSNIWADWVQKRPLLLWALTAAMVGTALWLVRALSLMDIDEYEYTAVLPTRQGRIVAGPVALYGVVGLLDRLQRLAAPQQQELVPHVLRLLEAALVVRIVERSEDDRTQLQQFAPRGVRSYTLAQLCQPLADNPYLQRYGQRHVKGAACFLLPEGLHLQHQQSREQGTPGFDLLFRFPGRGWAKLRVRLMLLERVRRVNWQVGEAVGVFAADSRPLVCRLWISGRFRVNDELLNAWLSLVAQDLENFLDFPHFIEHSHLELLLAIKQGLVALPMDDMLATLKDLESEPEVTS